jgi:hypothetical protein
MDITHAPGAGLGPDAPGPPGPWGPLGQARHLVHGHRAAVVAGVVLVLAAIVIPFGLHGIERSGASAAPATPVRPVGHTSTVSQHQPPKDAALGARGDLPALLPALLPAKAPTLRAGERVRVGDITLGSLRRTPQGWQVVVRWDGRQQALPTSGPVGLRAATTWVAQTGLLYTRVPTGTTGRFTVYAWQPEGGSAYTPPTLGTTSLGAVCFDAAFTDFGGCPKA